MRCRITDAGPLALPWSFNPADRSSQANVRTPSTARSSAATHHQNRDAVRLRPRPLPHIVALAPGWRESGARVERLEELAGCEDADLPDVHQGEQVLIAADDDVGLAGLGGFDEAVVVGVADDLDGLGGGNHDGREGQELDELVRIPMNACNLG